MTRIVRVERLLFGEKVAGLLAEVEIKGFDPDRVVVLASDGNRVTVLNCGLSRFELLGMLSAALEEAMNHGD